MQQGCSAHCTSKMKISPVVVLSTLGPKGNAAAKLASQSTSHLVVRVPATIPGTMPSIDNPLTAPPPAEMPLARAPLEKVIAQINFPEILQITNPDKVAPFQECLRKMYPFLKKESIHQFVEVGGSFSTASQAVWRLTDGTGSWTVSLATNFLGIETTHYTSRADFLARIGDAIGALEEVFEPPEASRLGIRYIDRVKDLNLSDIALMLRSEVKGITGLPFANSAQIAITESRFDLEEGILLARWGHLSENSCHDQALEPVDQPSWVLDLDMFTSKPIKFSRSAILECSESYAKRIYTFFRWAVNSDFLSHFESNLP
jgi:uncharacterized protein (TIGR04255 family)